MKPVLQVFQVDQCEHSFGHNSLHFERIITKILSDEFTGQELSYANMVAKKKWLPQQQTHRYIIMLVFVQLKVNLVLFFHSEKTFYTFGCCGGLLVTIVTVSGNLFLYSSKGITFKFRKFLPWYQNFSVRLLQFYESLLPWQQGKYQLFLCFKAMSLNLVHTFNVYYRIYLENFI